MYRRTKGLGAQGMLLAVAVLLFGLAACSNSGPGPTEQSSAPPTSSSGSAATPGAPDWPTTQQALPLNTCKQCQCPDLLNDSKYTSQVVFDNQRGYDMRRHSLRAPDNRIPASSTPQVTTSGRRTAGTPFPTLSLRATQMMRYNRTTVPQRSSWKKPVTG